MNRFTFIKKITPSVLPIVPGVMYFKFGYVWGGVTICILLICALLIHIEREIYGTRREYFLYSLFISILLIICMVCINFIPEYSIAFRLCWVFISVGFAIRFGEKIERQKLELQ